MTVTTLNEDKMNDRPESEPLHEAMVDATGDVNRDRAQRFYDRLRERIHSYAEARGTVAEKTTDFLLLVPDMFMLLWRLANDSRVAGKDKVLLGSGIAYYIFPLDIVPEMLVEAEAIAEEAVWRSADQQFEGRQQRDSICE